MTNKTQKRLDWYADEFEKIAEQIKGRKELDLYDFLRARNFKLQNSSRAEEDEIKTRTRKAFDYAAKGQTREAIEELTKLHGIAIPIASSILAMRFPNDYCIIDKRVIEELRQTNWLEDYQSNPQTYVSYLALMRQRATTQAKRLREYERELFEKSVMRDK